VHFEKADQPSTAATSHAPPGVERRSEIVRRKAQAERDWQEAQAAWEKNAGANRFDEMLADSRAKLNALS
jgi:hypothetical protein